MPNRLAKEASLYLLQHQDNPVDWYPWGQEPFERAKRENKPVLISIGYSSCHWCHVMAHESFENDYIAGLMNEHFVCIKVDREEHPGVDQIYMDAVQMLNGHGGWPLNVFCLPDGRPFAGGTYFPPDDRSAHQIVPWPQLLMRIADFYKRQLPDLVKNAEAIAGNLQATNMPQAAGKAVLGLDLFLDATHALVEHHDPVFGGFGKAPKFPPSMSLGFLLAMRGSATIELHHRELAGKLDTVINRTLTGMAHGGIYDQIGGGFARYSVDSQWLIPHFEKMLYDNALLVDIYARASHRYPKPLYQRIVEETIEWLDRDMRAPEGAYFAALDADTPEGEGSTYLWTPEEIEDILGPLRSAQFCKAYAITPEGNFENTGKCNPALLEADITIRDSLGSARRALLDARVSRIQPTCDNKRLTAWNALLARGLARAAFAFGRRDWLDSALSICEWIWEEMVSDGDRLFALSYGSGGQEPGTLDDYAYSAEAFLALAAVVDWQYPGHSPDWIDRAVRLTDAALTRFSEPDEPGFFLTGKEHELLVHRKKAWFDNAIPSGNASMVQVLSCLSILREDATYGHELERLGQIYPRIVNAAPGAASYALTGFVHRAIGLAVVTYRVDADLESLRQALASRPWRPLFLVPDPTGLQEAAYQLCVGTQCLPPTDSATSVAELL